MSLPTEKRNTWYKLGNQNLSAFMRAAGFDIAIYESYPDAVQEIAKRNAIRQAVKSLRVAYEKQTGSRLQDLKEGVYVIRLSKGMSIRYARGDDRRHSPIIYIGMGAVEDRIKSHYDKKLFEFMRSLGAVNFDFYVSEPWKRYHRDGDYHKQIEHDLIAYFGQNFLGVNGSGFPLMNKVRGSDRDVQTDTAWWRRPLKKSGSRTYWIIEPGPNSEFIGALD